MDDPLFRRPLPALLDREINKEPDDQFGHRHYARALVDLVRKHKAPYSIGLLGQWGVGKSSISQLCRERLTQEHPEIRAITFNAWRFGGRGGDIKRALFRHVFTELGGEEDNLNKRMWNTLSKTFAEARSAKERWILFGHQLGWVILQLIAIFGLFFGCWYILSWLGWIDPTQPIPQMLLTVGVVGTLARYLLSKDGLFVPGFSTVATIEAPTTNTEQFERALRDEIDEFWRTNRKTRRLVVFVDDLDRLSAEEMVDGLDGIRAFLEMPCSKTRDDFGIVFVISCDELRVARALRTREHRSSAELPGAVFTTNDARRYLDRIFQFRLEIPPFPRQDMSSFAVKKLRALGSEFEESMTKTKKTVEEIVSYLIHPRVQSPRNALQLVNMFAEMWWLAVHREADHSGSNRPGALFGGAATGHPIALAAISVFRVDFPVFYQDLLNQPSLIEDFRTVFLEGSPLSAVPQASRVLLTKYASKRMSTDPKEADNLPSDSQTNLPIRDDYLPLRSYLHQIESIRWPKHLSALLLLSQDPITNRLGEDGARVFDTLRQADDQSLMEILAHQFDHDTLSVDDSDLIIHAYEAVVDGADTLAQNNAAIVLSRVLDSLHECRRRVASTHAIRRIVRIPDLRWTIGVEKIGRLIEEAEADDRRDAIDLLSQSLWVISGKIDATTEDGGTPNLADAVTMVRRSVELALDIWVANGLNNATIRRLVSWLATRHISVGSESTHLEFSNLHSWLTGYDGKLKDHIAGTYIDQAASEFESNRLAGDEAVEVIEQLKELLERRWRRDQETNEEQWSVLVRLVAVKEEACAALALSIGCAESSLATAKQWCLFTRAALKRMGLNKTRDFAGAGLNTHVDRIMAATDQHKDDLDDDTLTALANAAQVWSAPSDSRFDLSLSIVRRLIAWRKPQAAQPLTSWMTRLTTNLPDEAIEFLGSNYCTFDTSVQNKCRSQFRGWIGKDAMSSEETGRIAKLLKCLPEDVLQEQTWQDELVNLQSRVAAMIGDRNWIGFACPVIATAIRLLPQDAGGQLLTQISVAMNEQPGERLSLFSEMIGNWPISEEGEYSFNTDEILARLARTCRDFPADPRTLLVVRAGTELCKHTSVGEDARRNFAESILHFWKEDAKNGLTSIQAVGIVPPAHAIVSSATHLVEEDSAKLRDLWSWCVSAAGPELQEQVARGIIASPPDSNATTSDWRLHTWFSCVESGDGDSFGLRRLLLADDSLNDNQHLRIGLLCIRSIVDSPDDLDDENLIDTLGALISTDHVSLLKRLDEARNEIATVAKSEFGRKSKAIDVVIAGFRSCAADGNKAVAARLLSALGDDNRVAEEAENMTLEEIRVLGAAIPGSQKLRKLIKKREKEEAAE